MPIHLYIHIYVPNCLSVRIHNIDIDPWKAMRVRLVDWKSQTMSIMYVREHDFGFQETCKGTYMMDWVGQTLFGKIILDSRKKIPENYLTYQSIQILKSFSRRFCSPESDLSHKIMRYYVYYSTKLCFSSQGDRNLSSGNDLYWWCTSFEKAFWWGQPLNILHSQGILQHFQRSQ